MVLSAPDLYRYKNGLIRNECFKSTLITVAKHTAVRKTLARLKRATGRECAFKLRKQYIYKIFCLCASRLKSTQTI